MMIGYARTSTIEQRAGLEAQIRDLKAAGCLERDIYREQVSSVTERTELNLVIDRILRSGDVLVVTKLDRLARSVADLVKIAERLKGLGAALRVLDSPIDMTSPYGELILHVLGAIAQFEREIMLSRQREGIAKAKSEGKYRGQPPHAMRKAPQVLELKAKGMGPSEIARQLDMGRSSVYRILQGAPAAD